MSNPWKKSSEADIKRHASEYSLPITAEEFTLWSLEHSARDGAILSHLQEIHKDKDLDTINRALCDWVAWVDFYEPRLVTIQQFIGSVYLIEVCNVVCIVVVKYPGDRANSTSGMLLEYLIDKELQKCLDN